VYSVLGGSSPELATQLHDHGWAQTMLRPVGVSPPVFIGARKKPHMYMMSGTGKIWFGSPIPVLAAALLAGIVSREQLRWGPITLTIKGAQLETLPAAESSSVLETRSPILLKAEGNRYLLPDDPGYAAALLANIRHKADLLGLSSDAELEVVAAGPRRRFEVSGGLRIGATAKIRLSADPRLTGALREWGLGLNNIQGFGWVR
jgi:CRISPR-associated endoribonuclease Cas6